MPQAGVRLFCPQNYDLEQDRQDEGVGHYSGTRTSIRFTDEYLHELEFPFTPNIRLPLMSLDESIPETGLSETLLMNLSYIKSDDDTMQVLRASGWMQQGKNLNPDGVGLTRNTPSHAQPEP